MLISPPPTSTATEPEADFATSPIFALMLEQLADALPPLETETPASAARRQEIARAIVIATHPADPIEAALAISAAVAYQTSLASNALAASPGLTSVQSNRYASAAIAEDRAFRAGVRHWPDTEAPPLSQPRRNAPAPPRASSPRPNPSSNPTTTRSPICPSSSPATATANRSRCIASAT
jgi:hypothetical protein